MNTTDRMEDKVDNITEFLMSVFLNKKFDIIGLYVPIFLSALVANILVIVVVIKDQYMRSVTNYFLVNLSIADLFVTIICMPNSAYNAYTSIYSFGETACKITSYLQCVSVASSIFTITTMAIDRYLAITRPFGFFNRCFNKKTTIIIIISLWLTSLLIFSPILIVTVNYQPETMSYPDDSGVMKNVSLNVYLCGEDWSRYSSSPVNLQNIFGIVWFVTVFVVPGLVMLFAYTMMSKTLCAAAPPFQHNDGMSCTQQQSKLIRSRKRVACILLLLAFVFAGCWLPYHITNLLDDAEGVKRNPNLQKYFLLIGHSNSALNPIIYCALSRKFRRSIKDLVCVRIEFSRRGQDKPWPDNSGSGTQLHYLHRLKSVHNSPAVHNPLHITLRPGCSLRV